ncbi:MAG: transcription antitermination factor NusB [Acidimicrobiia bacterium]
MSATKAAPKPDARRIALDTLVRIDTDGAFANLLLPTVLNNADLSKRDRAFVTELVYGTTRMRRACDWLVDRFLAKPPPADIRNALRLGVYQLAFAGTKPHAAVSATVAVVPPRAKPIVNAVLRRVAESVESGIVWPDTGTRLSYPDWIVDRLVTELGESTAIATLEHMNTPPPVTERDDGYVQDLASQWVAALVEVQPGERIADLCAAPGGKATLLARDAGDSGLVVATDLRPSRARLLQANANRLHAANLLPVAADAAMSPFAPKSFDRVLVDAPCSGLGALRRRPDARWRINESDIATLAAIQRSIIDAAIGLVRPGGVVVYSVCTLTDAESIAHDRPELEALPVPPEPWVAHGRGGRLLPQTADTDGMVVLRWRVQD